MNGVSLVVRVTCDLRIPEEIAEEFKRKPDLNLEEIVVIQATETRLTDRTCIDINISNIPIRSLCEFPLVFAQLKSDIIINWSLTPGLPAAGFAGTVARQETSTAAACWSHAALIVDFFDFSWTVLIQFWRDQA